MAHAHGVSAIVLFILFGLVVAHSAWTSLSPNARKIYASIAGLMAGGVALTLLALVTDHFLLVLEIVEIGLFAVYWVVATIENWGMGQRTTRASAG